MLQRLLVLVLKAIAAGSLILIAAVPVVSAFRWMTRPSPNSAEGLLTRADDLAWHNNWRSAFPLYVRAQRLFERKGNPSKALYAKVSQAPIVMESASLPALIAELNHDLELQAARAPDVRLRILEVKARCEEEYDASLSVQTFAEVEKLALDRYKLYLASRASGEIGVLSFTLGKFEDAATRVKQSYAVAKYLGDPTAHTRFAGMIGLGLTQMGKPKQALVFLNEAIEIREKHPEIAVPYVAINAKVDCLSSLGLYPEALGLADLEVAKLRKFQYLGQLQSLLTSRADALSRSGDMSRAIQDYEEALKYSQKLSAWRAINAIDGKLALAYERTGNLPAALSAVDSAIRANSQTPYEMFLVPGNLALKARILAEMGRKAEAENVFVKGAKVIDVLLSAVPTPDVQRSLLAQMGDFYSGYFRLISDSGRYADAFAIIERARGQIAAHQLEFDRVAVPRFNSADDPRLRELELKTLEQQQAYDRRPELNALRTSTLHPDRQDRQTRLQARVSLSEVQKQLKKNELLVEFVLAEPFSYALAIDQSRVWRYSLPSKKRIEDEVKQYRKTVQTRGMDIDLAHTIFNDLLGFIRQHSDANSVLIVADGDLHLLPFGALTDDQGHYLVQSRTVSLVPSGSVLHQIRTHADAAGQSRAYLGVAPWADNSDGNAWTLVRRGKERSRNTLLPLPQSKDEVESIAAMMPKPGTVLVGSQATKQKFESLPLQDYRILHLALHGIVDSVFPNRSSLVFAPSKESDGRLEARDIRHLTLRANLVTLSACNTAVGPVSSAGVESINVAFIEAGADAVVSTLWELDDARTNSFMKSFYSNLSRENNSSALRDAELELIHAGTAPYFWATYELLGDPTGSPVGVGPDMARR